jgi:hypothetical protein
MNFKNLIKSANAKFEKKFNGISKISANMLIFGQFFLFLILAADLLYIMRIISNPRTLFDIFASVQILFENSASGLLLLWLVAIFLDYIEKNNK